MQEQQKCSYRTGHIGVEIIPNGSSKVLFLCYGTFSFFILCFGIVIFRLGRKNGVVKNRKRILFPDSHMLVRQLSSSLMLFSPFMYSFYYHNFPLLTAAHHWSLQLLLPVCTWERIISYIITSVNVTI